MTLNQTRSSMISKQINTEYMYMVFLLRYNPFAFINVKTKYTEQQNKTDLANSHKRLIPFLFQG